MDRYCANEEDFHQRIIQFISGFPETLKTRPNLNVIVWAHELDLHDAGRNGGNGSADLVLADEEGMVWVIEVKFNRTSELGSFVWNNQLTRYKNAINSIKWDEIIIYTRSFLAGREKVKPQLDFGSSINSFTDILTLWQSHIGRVAIPPLDLKDIIASRLKSGKYGLMVMTDFYDYSYEDFGRNMDHTGSLAYVRAIPSDYGIDFKVEWCRDLPSAGHDFIKIKGWSDILSKKTTRCDPDIFASHLSPAALQLWNDVLQPGLLKSGWDGGFRKQTMGFEPRYNLSGDGFWPIIIGWPERDARNVAKDAKISGGASIRINPHIKRFFHSTNENIEITNRWMSDLYTLGWRGRPTLRMRERWGVDYISSDELKSNVQGIMQYEPTPEIRDHVGRPGDRASIEGFLESLSALINEIRRN